MEELQKQLDEIKQELLASTSKITSLENENIDLKNELYTYRREFQNGKFKDHLKNENNENGNKKEDDHPKNFKKNKEKSSQTEESDFSDTSEISQTSSTSQTSYSNRSNNTKKSKKLSKKKTNKKTDKKFNDSDTELHSKITEKFQDFGKNVPDLDKFEIAGPIKFSKYLKTFERYCENKFRGSRDDWTGELGKVLIGKMKEYYVAYGGSTVPYTQMKEKLTAAYRRYKTFTHDGENQAFNSAKMLPGEAPDIFALRLEYLFEKSHKNSNTQRSKTLKRKLINCLPKEMGQEIRKHMNDSKTLHNKSITWNQILKLINSMNIEDYENEKYGKEFEPQIFNANLEKKEIVNQRKRNKSVYNSQAKIVQQTCQWCGKYGHNELDCRRKIGACLACGDLTHKLPNCTKKNNGRTSRTQFHCSICSGNHPGIHCFHRRSTSVPKQQIFNPNVRPFIPRNNGPRVFYPRNPQNPRYPVQNFNRNPTPNFFENAKPNQMSYAPTSTFQENIFIPTSHSISSNEVINSPATSTVMSTRIFSSSGNV